MNELTVSTRFIKTTEVMKSKFIAILFPLDDDLKFKGILEDIKKEFPKAKHYVYAYKVGMKTKSCDDHEPKGTAGRPLLELILKKKVDNIALVVVRYFGGVELGAGRLLRTYVASGINVFNEATLVEGN